MSTFTTNKNIEQPAHGAYNNDWDVPVNANSGVIDTALGGNTVINVTGITGPFIAVTIGQYTPPSIEFVGTLSANLFYILPAGVGGTWTVLNATSGAFQLNWNVAGGTSVLLPQGYRSICTSDSANMNLADNGTAALAGQAAEAFAQSAANNAQANAETYALGVANTAQANAQNFASNGTNITSGTVAATRLPLIGNLGGVTIAVDPGTTPTGTAGQMFFYY